MRATPSPCSTANATLSRSKRPGASPGTSASHPKSSCPSSCGNSAAPRSPAMPPYRKIIRCGLELSVDFALTTSCYDPTPDGLACGRCDACSLRLKGFADNQLTDPAAYAK